MIESILEEIYLHKDVERVLKQRGWKDFENFVAWIFEQHEFKAKTNFRFSHNGKRFEIDVIAENTNTIFLVECKRWRGKAHTRYALQKACERHEERVKAFTEVFQKPKTIKGIIVTLLDAFAEEREILLVPVFKLNWFLLNYHTFI